ncbi:MAG: metallophosphoesterase [Candidatus Caldarchaeum sp.]|nr:metallophosphoesterase [Candidatus Caldarchaeum sp.]
MRPDREFRIVHISDTHITKFGMHLPEMLDGCIRLVNRLDPQPDLMIHTGDLTDNGILMDYEMAVEKMAEFNPEIIYVPGNHDERNYGDSLFREMVASVDVLTSVGRIVVLTLGSAIPDSDYGRLGRGRQELIKQKFRGFSEKILKIIAFHHHLIPVPFAGREKDILEDAGDVLRIINESRVNMVLMGHRHVRNAIMVGGTLLVNAGTVSCVRTRGRLGNSFNIIDVYSDGSVEVVEVSIPSGEERAIGKFKLFSDLP